MESKDDAAVAEAIVEASHRNKHSDIKQRPFVVNLAQNSFARALLIFAALNMVLGATYCPAKHSVAEEFHPVELTDRVPGSLRKPWSWWLARGYLTCAHPDVVVFGSSQMGSAQATIDAKSSNKWIDVITHRRISYLESLLKNADDKKRDCAVVSLAMPGAVVSDEYLMTKALFSNDHHPSTVLITIAPRDFIDDTLPSPAATDQFKFYAKFVDLGPLEQIAYSDPWDHFDFKLKQLPWRVLGTGIQALFKNETSATTSKATDVLQAVTAAATDPSQNQWVVPPQMPDKWTDNTLEYRFRFKGPNMKHYAAQMQFFDSWLADLRARNIKIVVAAMPSMEMNRRLLPETFWLKFRSDLANKCAQHDADWVDLSAAPEFEQKDYLDTVHLNARGAEKLMPRLAEAIIATRTVVSAQ